MGGRGSALSARAVSAGAPVDRPWRRSGADDPAPVATTRGAEAHDGRLHASAGQDKVLGRGATEVAQGDRLARPESGEPLGKCLDHFDLLQIAIN